MNPSIQPNRANHQTEEKFDDPMRFTNLVQPIQDLNTNFLTDLYKEESLTQDEYIVLDYIGATTLVKAGEVSMSFQGLRRLIQLHQARLTKALNRLGQKDLVKKSDAGYTLTDHGKELFNRLYQQYRDNERILPQNLYSHVAKGKVQGPKLGENQYKQIAENLVGKWFGNFRFVSKIEYENSFEINWISTNGSLSASLMVGPENNICISLSAPIFSEAQDELQILINHVSQSLESIIDAPVVVNNHTVYENRRNITHELDDAQIAYAG